MAQTGPKNILRREPEFREVPVKANAVIHHGGMVVSDAGFAAPGRAAAGLVTLGVAQGDVDNTGGGDGVARALVRRGCFRFENSGIDPVPASAIGKTVYVVDDETVAASDGGGARSIAGTCFEVEDDRVWVEVG